MSKSIVIHLNTAKNLGPHHLEHGPAHSEAFELEYELWSALQEISDREYASIEDICFAVYMTKPAQKELKAAMRYFIFDYFRTAATETGHMNAGHGFHHNPAMISTVLN